MLKVTPFLLFNGNCAEAMEFYRTCLGGDLTITTLRETPMKANMPENLWDKVAYAHLAHGAAEFSATDWMHPTRRFQQGNTVAMYITDGTYAELRAAFDKLAEGADPALLDDLADMPFGSYGHLADRFGVHWFFRGEKK